jgi:hypothetical protein
MHSRQNPCSAHQRIFGLDAMLGCTYERKVKGRPVMTEVMCCVYVHNKEMKDGKREAKQKRK